MIATWMLYASLLGLFVSLAAHALNRASRANGLPTRFVWLAAMVATLLAPVPGYVVRQSSANDSVVGGVAASEPVSGGLASTAAPSKPSALSTTMSWLGSQAVKVDRPVALIWAALTLILLGRLAVATGMLWRNRREWTAREIDGVPLFVTPNLGPAVVALPRSEILVPEWLLSLDATQISLVLCHEREHRLAGDPRLLVAATVLTALVPWNPALWWQVRRLRLAVEMDCDARVLRADPRIDRYGSVLLAIAQYPRAALYSAATLTESTSDLERRINAMTRTPSTAPRTTAATLGALAVAAVFAACMTPSPDLIVAPPDRPVAKAAGDAMFDFQVEQPAAPAPGNTPPKYPEQLRAAGVGGVVVAKFVVDTAGRADMKTFELIKSDHDLFTNSVRAALSTMGFRPAEVGGHRVKQLMQMPFVFTPSDGAPAASPARNNQSSSIPTIHRGREVVVGTGNVRSPLPRRTVGDTIPPAAKRDNSPPMYPNQLRVANIEGQVVARFVVRSDGTVDMGTFEVVESEHDLFANAVKNAVTTFQFSPATIKRKRVDWMLTMPFVFSLSK